MQDELVNGTASERMSLGGLNGMGPPIVAHLERCIRHLICRDLERSTSASASSPTARRLLLAPQDQRLNSEDVLLGEEGVGLDSLALISAASCVSRFFDLGASGVDDYLLFEPSLRGWSRCGLSENH